MDENLRREYELRAQTIRDELKQWESQWAAAHGGSKPARQDIKNSPEIAAKYKKYNQIRDAIAGKIPLHRNDERQSRKRRQDQTAPSETPRKRTKHTETPSKKHAPDFDHDLMNTPAISRKLYSPAAVSSLGPTPQRDGKVLGLFDLLVEKELRSPSKAQLQRSPAGAARRTPTLRATPSSKRFTVWDDDDDNSRIKLGRTPMSSSKRKLLNDFLTPLKRRDANAQGRMTPSSVSKLQFETPAFLKRHSLPILSEERDEEAADRPAPLKLPRKPLVRGLSEIVASLRKVEEEHLDDELDALREAEAELEGVPIQKPALITTEQAEHTLGGPNGPIDTLPSMESIGYEVGDGVEMNQGDGSAEDGTARQTPAAITWKKKGQKRTTRKSNIKPIRVARPAEAAASPDEAAYSVEDSNVTPFVGVVNPSAVSDLKFTKEARHKQQQETTATKPKEGTVKKTVRKVNELAHANFHRLKLRNKSAKRGQGFNSKFRRRR